MTLRHVSILLMILATLLLHPSDICAAGYFVDGTSVEIPYGQQSRRIVSLAPNVTEMLFYCGFGGQMVGRTDYCDFPLEAQNLPTVGGLVDTGLESIFALSPDLVVAYQGNSLELISQLRQLGINVVAFREAETLSTVADQMEQLSLIAGDGSSVPAVIGTWRDQLAALKYAVTGTPPSVFYGMPGEVAYTAGDSSFIGDLILLAGGRNAATGINDRWPQVGAEFILASNPDWLLVGTSCDGHESVAQASMKVKTELMASPLWRSITAVSKEQIVIMDAGELLRPGPRILEALRKLQTSMGAAD